MSRKRVAALAFLVALPILASWPASVGSESRPQIAVLSYFEGAVIIVRAGLAVPLTTGLPLVSDDLVRTRAGHAVIRFDDGTVVKVRPDTRLAISERTQKREIDVFIGRLWALVVTRKDRETAFRTGGTIAAVRGTKLEYGAGADGAVDVGLTCDSTGSTIGLESVLGDGTTADGTLNPCQQSNVPKGGKPGDPRPFAEGDIAGPDPGGTMALVAPHEKVGKEIGPEDSPQTVKFIGWVQCPGEEIDGLMHRHIEACQAGDGATIERVRSFAGSALEYYGCKAIAPAGLDAKPGAASELSRDDAYIQTEVEQAFAAEREACLGAYNKNP